MAPRQRLSPQPSMDETTASSLSPTSPLISSTSTSFNSSSNNNKNDGTASPNNIIHKESSSLSTVTGARKVLVSEEARAHHDYFNLLALVCVIASASVDWDFGLLFQGMGSLAYKGEYFWLTWGVVQGYFLIDLLWVLQIPHCVKSPKTIQQHHMVVICYMLAPVVWPEYRWFMGALLSVEINTWFMILRRIVYKKKIAMLSNAVALSFYGSWIIIRCYIYPAVLIHFLQLADVAIRQSGRFWHWPMMFIPVHFALCCLNLKWSFDLFYPIIKSWVVRDADKPTVSSGL